MAVLFQSKLDDLVKLEKVRCLNSSRTILHKWLHGDRYMYGLEQLGTWSLA